MGKYIRKAKLAVGTADLAVMETSLGVRTRAKTLAAKIQPSVHSSASSYLQLRSRRLLKHPVSVPTHYSKRQKQSTNQTTPNPDPSHNPNSRASSRRRMASSESVGSYLNNSNNDINSEGVKRNRCEESREVVGRNEVSQENENNTSRKCDFSGAGLGEASFGENVLEFEGRERSTRESTPSSLIGDPDVRTLESTTSLSGNRQRLPDSDHRHILTSNEMDEFFASAEEEQQRDFIAKYNFDPLNDKPLPGRYEWEQLDPPDSK